MTHYKIKANDKTLCVACLIEKELILLVENDYHNKMKILQTLDKAIIRNDIILKGSFEDYYGEPISHKHAVIINDKLLKIESMIFDNANQSDVLKEVGIIQYTSRLFADQDKHDQEKVSYLRSQKNYAEYREYQ